MAAEGIDGVAASFSNPQMRSLVFPAGGSGNIPPYEPEDKLIWEDLVDKVISRFTIFRMTELDIFTEYCRDKFDLALKLEPRKVKPYSEEAAGMIAEMTRHCSVKDNLWLDRLLYARSNAGRSSIGRAPAIEEPAGAIRAEAS